MDLLSEWWCGSITQQWKAFSTVHTCRLLQWVNSGVRSSAPSQPLWAIFIPCRVVQMDRIMKSVGWLLLFHFLWWPCWLCCYSLDFFGFCLVAFLVFSDILISLFFSQSVFCFVLWWAFIRIFGIYFLCLFFFQKGFNCLYFYSELSWYLFLSDRWTGQMHTLSSF